MATADSLFRALDLIQPGDLVAYHGSLAEHHGIWLAEPCSCPLCRILDRHGLAEARYQLIDPWGEELLLPVHVRRKSISRAVGGS